MRKNKIGFPESFRLIGNGNLRFGLLMWLSIIAVSAVFYHGFDYIVTLPGGIHQWKQSMHFSIVQNLADGTATFWHPAIHNLFNADLTGKLILEFPLIHWLASFFMPDHPVLFRLTVLIITLWGVYHSARLIRLYVAMDCYAVLGSLLFFAVPVLVFYGGTYMVDVAAMALGVSSVYYFERYFASDRFRNLFIALTLLTLSGLLRLPVLVFPLAYLMVSRLTGQRRKALLGVLISFLLIGCWYYYVRSKNTYWVAYPPAETYFYLSAERIAETWHEIRFFMLYQLGACYRNVLFYFLVVLFFIRYRKELNRFWMLVLLFHLIGSVVYVILWFGIFRQHDYYMVPMLPLYLLIWLNVLIVAQRRVPPKVTLAILFLVLAINGFSTADNLKRRYEGRGYASWISGCYETGMWRYFADEDRYKWRFIRELSPFSGSTLLIRHGVLPTDTILCDFDQSPCYSLGILNRKGWTRYNSPLESLEQYSKYACLGAKYLVCLKGKKSLADSVEECMLKQNLLFEYDSIAVYSLEHLRKVPQ